MQDQVVHVLLVVHLRIARHLQDGPPTISERRDYLANRHFRIRARNGRREVCVRAAERVADSLLRNEAPQIHAVLKANGAVFPVFRIGRHAQARPEELAHVAELVRAAVVDVRRETGALDVRAASLLKEIVRVRQVDLLLEVQARQVLLLVRRETLHVFFFVLEEFVEFVF